MKVWGVLCVLAVLIILAVSCGGPEPAPPATYTPMPPPTPTPTPTATPTTTPTGVGDTTPPSLVIGPDSFNRLPATVDTSNSAQTVRVNVTVTDDLPVGPYPHSGLSYL